MEVTAIAWGADVIGMTALPEAKLAREAEICYGLVAMSTDYDAWHEAKEAVSVDVILSTLRRNVEMSKQLIKYAVLHVAEHRHCGCASALAGAIVDSPGAASGEAFRILGHAGEAVFDLR